MRQQAFICWAALLAFGLTGCWEGISVHVLATVLAVRGQATVRTNKSANVIPVTTDSTIGGGEIVTTDAGSELNLILIPGIMIRLFENSELQIEELSLTKDGNETEGGMKYRSARLRLNRGRAIAYFADADGTQGQFVIETARVVVTAKAGTLWQIATDQRVTRVVAAIGAVYTLPANGGTSAALPEGFFRTWPSEIQQPIAAADDPQAQAEVTGTVAAGNEMRDLRQQNLPRRNRFPR